MKEKVQVIELSSGLVILIGGLVTYWFGWHENLPIPRPNLLVYGTTLIGTLLIILSFQFFKPSKEQTILENDERNIAITNASLATGFAVMTTLLVLVLFALIFMGYMNKVVFFSIVVVIFIGQATWMLTARYLERRM